MKVVHHVHALYAGHLLSGCLGDLLAALGLFLLGKIAAFDLPQLAALLELKVEHRPEGSDVLRLELSDFGGAQIIDDPLADLADQALKIRIASLLLPHDGSYVMDDLLKPYLIRGREPFAAGAIAMIVTGVIMIGAIGARVPRRAQQQSKRESRVDPIHARTASRAARSCVGVR